MSRRQSDQEDDEIPDGAVDARELSPQQMEELMPNQKPSIIIRVFMYVVMLVTFAIVFSPAVAWYVWGIEAAVAFFMTGLLVVFTQR